MQPSLPPPSVPVAGWYPDRDREGAVRYWDGRGWTEQRAVPVGPAPRAAHPTLPLGAAIGALVVLGASLTAGRLLLEGLVQYRWPIAVYVALTAVIGYGPALAWCIAVGRRAGPDRWWARIGLEVRPADIGWGPVAWLACLGSQFVVAAIILATRIPLSSNTEGIEEVAADRTYVLSLLVMAVVAAPFVEEVVFRGVVLRGLLSRTGPVLAIALQAVLFGLAHVDPVRGVGNIGLAMITGAIGAMLGGAAYLLRRIGASIIAHAILNGVVLAIVLTGVLDDV